jgi:hypothetical protein
LICVSCAIFTWKAVAQKEEPQNYCKSLSSDITSEMLVGTWLAEPGTGTDQITLKADHSYSQKYSNPVAQFSFQTEQNNWEVDVIDGITCLHLESMHKCDSYESTCSIKDGGGGDDSWVNFCTGKVVQMKGFVTLVVLRVVPGDIYYSLSDLKLCHFLSDPDGSGVCYRRISK